MSGHRRSRYTIGIVGRGCVGNALYKYCKARNHLVVAYDVVAARSDVGTVAELASQSPHVIIVALPTEYDNTRQTYNLDSIHSTMQSLIDVRYAGPVVLKSTVLPGTTDRLRQEGKRMGHSLSLFHSPEFISEATVELDTRQPMTNDCIIGVCEGVSAAEIARCQAIVERCTDTSTVTIVRAVESEFVKVACNGFYAAKLDFFNRIHDMCGKMKVHYPVVRNLVVRNGWVHNMHTFVPGPADGKVGFGGRCLPKDSAALQQWFQCVSPSSLDTVGKETSSDDSDDKWSIDNAVSLDKRNNDDDGKTVRCVSEAEVVATPSIAQSITETPPPEKETADCSEGGVRLTWDAYFMSAAELISRRSSCSRLHVGCVVTKRNRIVSAGYNGYLTGAPHDSIVRDGHELATIHAEQNAIADCAQRGVVCDGGACYVTHYPCLNCAKVMAAAGIQEIIYKDDYRNDPIVAQLLSGTHISIRKYAT